LLPSAGTRCCKIHTVLTDNGIQFRLPPRYADGPTTRFVTHMFAMRCRENGIEHRCTKINHPWTNGQVERMNRTIKEATVQCYHYDSHAKLKQHLDDFVDAYNFGRRLKTLKGLSPYEFICKAWTSQPERFILNPLQQMPGLNNEAIDHVVPLGSELLVREWLDAAYPALGKMGQ
jgi:transposase InsO family protein